MEILESKGNEQINSTLDSELETLDFIAEALRKHPKHLSIMHLNTQSMVSSFNEFQTLVSDYPMDIITMSETWLKENPALLDYVALSGYTAIFNSRDTILGGGVGAYISNSINFKRRKDIENLQTDFEHLWFEIPGRNKHSKALIGVIYRSERMLSCNDWLDRFESLLGQVSLDWDGLLYVTGDVNIDMLNSSHSMTKQYKSVLDVLGMHQHVTKPTRVTPTSRTLIDHIITNYPQCVAVTDIIPSSTVSDHDGVFACINVRVPRYQPRHKLIRNEKNFNEEEFKKDCSELPMSVVYGLESLEDMVETLNTRMY
jgi:exonuclease III